MNFSIKRIVILSRFKFRELFKNKTFLLTASLVPLITLLMRFVYQNMMHSNNRMSSMMLVTVLNLGLTLNLTSVSLMMPATMLAKEKEKKTLRVLMTSSVKGVEYFVSSIIPSFSVSVVINMLILLLSGIDLTNINVGLYMAVTTIACVTSCILGMLIGLFAKDQMSSGNLSSILMLVLMLVPMMSNMVESLDTVNEILYTGIASKLVTSFVDNSYSKLSVINWSVLGISLFLVSFLFIMNYKKRGFEKD